MGGCCCMPQLPPPDQDCEKQIEKLTSLLYGSLFMSLIMMFTLGFSFAITFLITSYFIYMSYKQLSYVYLVFLGYLSLYEIFNFSITIATFMQDGDQLKSSYYLIMIAIMVYFLIVIYFSYNAYKIFKAAQPNIMSGMQQQASQGGQGMGQGFGQQGGFGMNSMMGRMMGGRQTSNAQYPGQQRSQPSQQQQQQEQQRSYAVNNNNQQPSNGYFQGQGVTIG